MQAKNKRKMLEMIQGKMAELDEMKIDERMTSKLKSVVNSEFGNLQESLDEILGPLPSDNSK